MLDDYKDGYDKFLRGELPEKLILRSGPRPRLYCVSVGAVDFARSEVCHDVHAVL
jgi:hypothetical protein